MSNEGVSTVTARVPIGMQKGMEPVLKREGVTMSEFIRLCCQYVSDNGELPFKVPVESRDVKRRASFTTFFS